MQPNLVFRVLSAPLSDKVLSAFRDDAGWTDHEVSSFNAGDGMGGVVRWVAVESGKRRIAIARLELAPPQFCYVSDLIVLRAFRGRGVGGWFMKQIELHCLANGVPRVVLRPLDGSRAFYDKLQFVADPLVNGFMKKELIARRRLAWLS